MKYGRNMAIYFVAFIIIVWVGISNCASQVTVDNLYYDIEVKQKAATYPPADTVYTITNGDTLTIAWNQELRYANAADSAKTWDTGMDWTKAVQGYQYPLAFPEWTGELTLTPGVWSLRVWTWLFNPDKPAGQGRWSRSPAPTDEVQLEVIDTAPVTYPRPANPVLINVRVR